MKIEKFIIKNYRAITEMSIPISNSITPIIGVNESGKTTVLKAILAFDKQKDTYNKGEHLIAKNKYLNETEREDCTITAEVKIQTQEEINEISKKLRLSDDNSFLALMQENLDNKKAIQITRHISSEKRNYTIDNEEIEEGKSEQYAKAIVSKMPFILYFDDFSDRVPEKIDFTIKQGKAVVNTEWRSIVQEIFKRAGKLEVDDFLAIEDDDDRDNVLTDVTDELNKEIITEWLKLKESGNIMGKDEEDLSLKLDYSNNPAEPVFKFKVSDRTTNKGRSFNIGERSKGFQWYFNFIIKLKYNPKYLENPDNAIYLLDEPGSYLHSSAQEELLKILKEISDKNVLLFCTHSQYLLNPDVINPNRIKIAQKDCGNINLISFSSYGKGHASGALTPLYEALQLNIAGNDLSKNKIIITEGLTDYYFLKMAQDANIISKKGISIIPGNGAKQLSHLISLGYAFSKGFLIILDGDKEGVDGRKKYIKEFGDDIDDNIVMYGDKICLEQIIDENSWESIYELTGGNEKKNSIISLFYQDSTKRNRIMKKIDNEDFKNLIETIKEKMQ